MINNKVVLIGYRSLQAMLAVAVVVILTACSGVVRAGDEQSDQAIEYVQNLSKDCTLGDGYQCETVDEMTLTMEQQRLVPARYLVAWPIALADFKAMQELSDVQKNLQHYKIGFGEDEQHFIVMFRALLLPQLGEAGQPDGLLRATFGKSLRYKIKKHSLKIVARHYYR